MINKSELQETYEQRVYYIRRYCEEFTVEEGFYFNSKREGRIYPSKYCRKGTQFIFLKEGKENGPIIIRTCNKDVLEDASSRKDLIFKFLKNHFGSLKNIECFLYFPK